MLLFLLGGSCVNCLSVDNLEFDHVIPEEMKFRIGTKMLARLEILLPELQKCQLLCHSCHVQKTNTEQQYIAILVHGTASGYTNHKCRCDLCKIAWNKYLKGKQYYRKKLHK